MDQTDYEAFDFDGAAREIQSLGAKRGASAIFADAVCAIYFKAKEGEVLVQLLESCLGRPDRLTTEQDGTLTYEYDWVGFLSIPSATCFVVKAGKVIGVAEQRQC